MYLYGKKQFTLVTDHKPLLNLMSPKCGLPKLISARLQRWSVVLAYNYALEYRSTTDMGNADTLSPLPVDRAPNVQKLACVMLTYAHPLPISSQQIALYTGKDPLLSKVLQSLISGKDDLLSQAEFIPLVDRCMVRVLSRKRLHIERS